MNDSLHPYQLQGAQFLASRNHAYLGDDMGLGKTPQAIHAADLVGAENILVICPAIARVNWAREFRRWSGTARPTRVIEKTGAAVIGPGITIVSYEGAVKHAKALADFKFDLIVFDEFHYLKSAKAKRAQVLIGDGGLAHSAKRVWLLSGTAIANHPGEIWTGLQVFYPAALREPNGTYLGHDAFIERYCVVRETPYGAKVVGVKDLTPLKRAMTPFFLRRTVDDIHLELPPYVWADMPVRDLPKSPGVFLKTCDDTQVKQWLASDGAYQLQPNENTSSLMHILGLEKCAAVAELARDTLDSGIDKLVIFAWHTDVIDALHIGLSEFNAVAVDGSCSPSNKQASIDAFQGDPRCRVFIGQIKTCGTAIDLTAAHHALFAEMSWVPSDNTQAAKRLHRVTQTKPVLIRCVKLVGSLDDAVTATLRRKSSIVNQLFN